MRQLAFFLLIGCSCVVSQDSARAQGSMRDPMQPPGIASASSSAPAARSGVQVIITSPQRSLALIDGVVVPVGAQTKGGTLASVSDSLVVLKKNGVHDVILVHPDISKRPARRERP